MSKNKTHDGVLLNSLTKYDLIQAVFQGKTVSLMISCKDLFRDTDEYFQARITEIFYSDRVRHIGQDFDERNNGGKLFKIKGYFWIQYHQDSDVYDFEMMSSFEQEEDEHPTIKITTNFI